MRQRFFLLMLLVFTSANIHSQSDTVTKYLSVGPEEFLTLMRFRENAVLIDVRLPFEYRKERIENSVNIPLGKKFIKKMSHFPGNSVILLYCTTDVRSRRAAERLYDAGYRNLYNLEGGLEAWKRKNLPVTGRKADKYIPDRMN
ncbi:MAG TPA: rhodanese-like domain-containing protein [Bacteroidales bacterium]|nr:rhodanese-like domain-containing protein [Bacteroidales bacterium]HRT90795.1 rhodanese-like domain-containing protein [Bacteroidales bacterium]